MRRLGMVIIFAFLDAVHPQHGIPHRSLIALGLVAACFCFFSLAQVITMLVITRILLQFFLQQVGVMLLRVQRPELGAAVQDAALSAAAAGGDGGDSSSFWSTGDTRWANWRWRLGLGFQGR